MVELTVNMYRVHLKSFALLSQLSELVSGVFEESVIPRSRRNYRLAELYQRTRKICRFSLQSHHLSPPGE